MILDNLGLLSVKNQDYSKSSNKCFSSTKNQDKSISSIHSFAS